MDVIFYWQKEYYFKQRKKKEGISISSVVFSDGGLWIELLCNFVTFVVFVKLISISSKLMHGFSRCYTVCFSWGQEIKNKSLFRKLSMLLLNFMLWHNMKHHMWVTLTDSWIMCTIGLIYLWSCSDNYYFYSINTFLYFFSPLATLKPTKPMSKSLT